MHNPVNRAPYSYHGEYSPIVSMVNTGQRTVEGTGQRTGSRTATVDRTREHHSI